MRSKLGPRKIDDHQWNREEMERKKE